MAVMGKVDTVKLAKDAVRKEAEEMNQPIVRLYRLAAEYGVLVSESDFKKYKKENKIAYDNAVGTYGENSVRHAYQFDKLMDFFLETDETEKDAETVTGNEYVFVEVTYKNALVGYVTEGTPASEAAKEAESK